MTDVTIPEGVIEIGAGSFEGCTALNTIVIPESTVQIALDAFVSCGGLIIHAPTGSPAEQYAKEVGISFRPI